MEGELWDDLVVLEDECDPQCVRTISEDSQQIASGWFDHKVAHRDCHNIRLGCPPNMRDSVLSTMIWLQPMAHKDASNNIEFKSCDITFMQSWAEELIEQQRLNSGGGLFRLVYRY